VTYWKDSYLIGVPEIDNQHIKLVQAIDKFTEACSQGRGRASIEQTLNFVVMYTKDHFRDEESIQAKYSYPGLIAHKRIHAAFIQDVGALVEEFKKVGPNVALTGRINKTLVDWLIKHISTEDKKVGDHIIKVNAK